MASNIIHSQGQEDEILALPIPNLEYSLRTL